MLSQTQRSRDNGGDAQERVSEGRDMRRRVEPPRRELATSGAMARVLMFRVKTVRDMARSGEIPSIRVRGQFRFDPDAVIEALTRRGGAE